MTYAILGAFLGLLSLIGYGVVAMIKEAARNEERAEQAKKQAQLSQKQAETMLKERSVEDVARDLDDGRF